MANYPGADPSFPTRSNGQTIDASHINGAQDEIVAIGTALRGTLAHAVTIASTSQLTATGPANLGASTVATLSVTGGSTFAGAVVFSGGQTFAAPLTLSSGGVVSTGVIRQNSLPAWDVFHSTYIPVGSGSTGTGISFDSQNFVRGNIEHSTTTNSSRVTVNTTGLYEVGYQGFSSVAGSVLYNVDIRFNDGTVLLRSWRHNNVANGFTESLKVGGIVRADSTGYFSVTVGSAGAASTHGSTFAPQAARFSGHFIG